MKEVKGLASRQLHTLSHIEPPPNQKQSAAVVGPEKAL